MSKAFDVVNPARFNEVVGQVPMRTEADSDRAITAASRAYSGWSRASVDDRAKSLRDAGLALSTHAPDLTTLFVRENGKPLREAERDIRRSIELMQLVAEELPRWSAPELYDAS